jgi:hypothetical protein
MIKMSIQICEQPNQYIEVTNYFKRHILTLIHNNFIGRDNEKQLDMVHSIIIATKFQLKLSETIKVLLLVHQ